MIILAAVVGYLIGSVSPARLVGRKLADDSIAWGDPYDPLLANGTTDYTGVSGTAVMERFGAKWGATVMILDGFKALIPTLAASLLLDDATVALAVAAGVIAGHIWPLFYRLHGGRGQACTIGAMLVIDPLGLLVMIAAGVVIGLTAFTSVHLARSVYPSLAFPWFVMSDGPGPTVWFGLAVSLMTLIAMIPDIRADNDDRRRTEVASMPWPRRLGLAWRTMFDPES